MTAEKRPSGDVGEAAGETSGERRLRHRLEKIDAVLDQLGAPKDDNWEGLTVALSQVGRILRLVGKRRDADGQIVTIAPSSTELGEERTAASIYRPAYVPSSTASPKCCYGWPMKPSCVESCPHATEEAKKLLLHRLSYPSSVASARVPMVQPVAYIEHHKGGDNLVWDDPGGKRTPLYVAAPLVQPEEREPIFVAGLHPATAKLVNDFALALAEKLKDAQIKYGYEDGWADSDWGPECQERLAEHVKKGDPRDVAAYCAFMWFHDWPTSPRKAKP
jgi:hypothetical protein